MTKILQIANGVALIVTIVMNYLSNTGIFNHSTMATVSARYQNCFTPAGYAFSIWGLIYLGLLWFVIYQGRSLFRNRANDGSVLQIGIWFVVSCIANCLWILAWLYDYTGLSVLIMLLLLFSLLKIVVNTHMEKTNPPLGTIASVWWPFSLYIGWITAALFADIAAYITKTHWSAFGLPPSVQAIIMICLAGFIYLLLTWTRNMREYAFAGIWALVAVAIANLAKEPSVTLTAFVVSGLLFVSASIHGYRNRMYSPWKRKSDSAIDGNK